MRLKSSIARLKSSVDIGTIQGVAGALCVAVGALMLWGRGWALIALGAFLLIGAWGSS